MNFDVLEVLKVEFPTSGGLRSLGCDLQVPTVTWSPVTLSESTFTF